MNITKKTVSLLLILTIVFSFACCGREYEASSFTVNKKETALKVSADTDKKALYLSKDRALLTPVAKSDMTVLYFDKENFSVSLYDTATGKIWSSLPSDNYGVKTSVLSVTVLIDGNKYTLSSQSDSVAFSTAAYEIQEKGITVKYAFKRTLEDGRKIDLTVPLSYILADGALRVEADCAAVVGQENSSDIILTDIDILPFFGANRIKNGTDYILLPDSSGVTLAFSENPEEFGEIGLPVYEKGTLLGAFGMKNSDSAYASLINEGAEIACIKATKALSKRGCNSVWPSFEITDTLEKDGRVFVSSESYKGKIGVLYRFLSFDNADYVGMAGAVRELLIRDGRLLSENNREDTDYPFNMSLTFQNYVTDSKGKTLSQTLTTYEQALELLSDVKAKGIENINVRLKGIFNRENITETDFSSEPGSRKELERLISDGHSLGVSFFADTDIITSYAKKPFARLAVALDGEALIRDEKIVVSAEDIEKNVNALLSLLRESEIDGICLSDAGKELFADYRLGGIMLRNEVAGIISKEVSAVSASKKLMVDKGNIYSVKYAGSIVGIPYGSLTESSLCTPVPFIQTILHGLTDYSLAPVNLSENTEKAFLKAVEYGAVPSYEWYAADLSTKEKTDNYSYLNCLTQAQSQYERAAACFSDLRQARITDHYRVKKNVYYTQYDNSTGVYVNYNDKAVTVGGVTVEGMSFLRVN